MRQREVEVHLVDLGVGYETADWPEHYLAAELPRLLTQLPLRLDGPGRRALTAWLLERGELPSDLRLGPWQPPGPPS
jgi:maleylpyruvate isomerase